MADGKIPWNLSLSTFSPLPLFKFVVLSKRQNLPECANARFVDYSCLIYHKLLFSHCQEETFYRMRQFAHMNTILLPLILYEAAMP